MSDEKHALLPCPFCGASPHRGAIKRTGFQDGSENQDYRIWCPHLCAQMERSSEAFAVASWNRREAKATQAQP